MKLKLQNVGGIVEPTSIELKEGLNVIRAPNATGKTSFTHGLKLASLDNQQLRNHPEFVNDFSDKATVEIDGQKRVIEKKGFSPMSKTEPLFRLNGRQDIIFAMPENEFLNSIIRGEPIDKFLESFSDAQYYKQLIEKEGVLREVENELDDEYGDLNTDAKNAQSIRKNLENENKDLIVQREKKLDIQNKLEEMKSKIKMNKEEEGRLSQLTEDIEDIELNIGKSEGSIVSWKDDIKKKESEISERKEEMQRFLKEFRNVEDIIKNKLDRINKIEKELDNDEEGLYNLDNQIDIEIKITESNLEGNNCLACGRDFTQQQKKQRLQKLKTQKDKLTLTINKLEDENLELNKNLTTIKERRKKEFSDNKDEIDIFESSNTKNIKNISDAEAVIERLSKNLKQKIEAKELVKSKVDPKIKKLIEDEESLTKQVNGTLKTIKTYEIDYELVADSEKQVVTIKAKYEFLKRVENLIKEELANLKNIVKNDFNKKIMPIYNKLGFKDFKNIEIDSTFRIKVNRKGREQELNRLSTSERVTLGVVVMLAGKEEYLPEYPFFVLDEITTAYDPARFKKIIEYLANETKTQYTIVTAFSPTGNKIKVEHSL